MSRVLYQLSYAADRSPDCTDWRVRGRVSLVARNQIFGCSVVNHDSTDHRDVVTATSPCARGHDMGHGIVTKGLAASAAALAAVTATAGVALAAGDSVALPSTAKLIAKGVDLSYAVQYTCQPSDQFTNIAMDARENVRGWVAHGSTSDYNLTCDGAKHVATIVLPADANGRAFTPGQVYTTAMLQASQSTTASAARVVIAKR
jgi:hypothetical protein